MKKRAKKGGEIAMNGEFYKGGLFLPSTRLPKQTPTKNSTQPHKPLNDWQIENIKKAIAGTETALAKAIAENDQAAINGNTAQLAYLKAKISK